MIIVIYTLIVGGGFKYFSFSPLLGERFPFSLIFFEWVETTVTLFKSNEGILDHLMSISGKFVSTESSKPKQGREKPTTRNDETWGCTLKWPRIDVLSGYIHSTASKLTARPQK